MYQTCMIIQMIHLGNVSDMRDNPDDLSRECVSDMRDNPDDLSRECV